MTNLRHPDFWELNHMRILGLETQFRQPNSLPASKWTQKVPRTGLLYHSCIAEEKVAWHI